MLERISTTTKASIVGAGVLVFLLNGCAASQEPKIVAGVPAQVDYKIMKSKPRVDNPGIYVDKPYLALEQCPEDISKAVHGEQIVEPSFDERTHTYNPACFITLVETTSNAYKRFEEGAVITFQGNVGDPVTYIK